MTNEASALLDTDAHNKAMDADAALQDLGSDLIGEAYVTATLTVWDEDPRLADEKLRLAEKVIQGRDFTSMTETVNAIEAWLGSLPGHVYANVRQPPISTLNLAHMIPLSAVWAGPLTRFAFWRAAAVFRQDRRLDALPLFAACRRRRPHADRRPDRRRQKRAAGVDGPAVSPLQPESQIFIFDFGGSARAATLAMGGDWNDLGGSLAEDAIEPVALQPLARINEVAERAWAAEWVASILARENVAVTPEVKEHLWSALTSLASAPVDERTLTGLSVLLQSNALKRRSATLLPRRSAWPAARRRSRIFGRSRHPDLRDRRADRLFRRARRSRLSLPSHRRPARSGRRRLIIIDEGWLALDDKGFASQLREWLKTLRKKNASVVFATQSLADIETSPIAPAIVESCLTRLFLPNERAMEPQITAIYRRFGLNDRQIEIIARATPKRDYYCQSRRGNRLFELGLGPLALALCAASSKTDQKLISQLFAEHGRENFARAWLVSRGLAWAADLLPQDDNQEQSS